VLIQTIKKYHNQTYFLKKIYFSGAFISKVWLFSIIAFIGLTLFARFQESETQ